MAPDQRKQDKNQNTDTSRKAGSRQGENQGGSQTDRPDRSGRQEDDDDRSTREGRDQGRSGGSSRE